MNPEKLFCLSKAQQDNYYIQPDLIAAYERESKGNCELPLYVKGTSMRFWFNIQQNNFPIHWHNAIEIIVPIESGYTVHTQQVKYDLLPGDILIIPSGELHSLKAPPTGSRLILLFDPCGFSHVQGFSYFLSALAEPAHISYDTHPELYEKAIRLLMQVCECYWGSSIAKGLFIHAFMMELFAVYSDYCFQNNSSMFTDSHQKKEPLSAKLTIVLEYLDKHYADTITLEQAASMAGFSKFYFSRIFKQYTNQTFYDYLVSKRIRIAEQLLITPGLAITEIAQKIGFSSISSFNRSFRNTNKCTPSEYRSLHSPIH